MIDNAQSIRIAIDNRPRHSCVSDFSVLSAYSGCFRAGKGGAGPALAISERLDLTFI